MNAKKLLIILSTTFLTVLLALLIVINIEPTNTGSNKNTNAQPTPTPPTIQKNQKTNYLSHGPAIAPYIYSDGTVKYLTKSGGNLFQSNLLGNNIAKISNASLNDLTTATWSYNGQKIIATFSERRDSIKYLFNYDTGETMPFSNNISKITFSPNTDKIAYLTYDKINKSGGIFIANSDLSNAKKIFDTTITDWQIAWPAKDIIIIITSPSGLAQGAVYGINTQTGDYQILLSDLYGLNTTLSPDGARLIYSYTDAQGKNLKTYSMNIDGSNKYALPFSTISDKCIFSQDTRNIFCAVIKDIPPDSLLPDDYYQDAFKSRDDFVEYDLIKKESSRILFADDYTTNFDASNLLLTPEEDYLIFINRQDGLLYSLKL
ncbi:MAG: hypothetical protein COU81_01425 [Candidatus Portnoybacteria bacterium CG10_big_fil_rev_8_21_14_0_10_36_7]|uniref:Dipeptidylpeptidase IV N-terminal domain-containing protein n=1 Tax=Candidatus Portnoybacteria bacterium CG10_big_fil_rev_8_21_14_0_10_36_7 TaxID=1974812 RepID=A0A2M8KEE9_9BACT|nr:MAG: hypothetical protein COU81_01425 [Candidatus Portnoybacteria bacterium CG10_big_fil_rev_8_21_14_0_10_36_7]